MARGPKVDRQELRGAILAVATEMVQENGFAGLSIRKIATKIGCAVGTIYNVYANLDEIILTINSVTLANLHTEMEHSSRGCTDSKQTMLKLGQTYVEFSNNQYHLWTLLVDYKPTSTMKIPEWYEERVEALFGLVSDMVAPIVHHDKARADRAAKVLWASLHGVCSLAVSGKLNMVKAENAAVLAESLVGNYIKGLECG